MSSFTAVSPSEATFMAMGFGHGYRELTNAEKADRDWKMAAALDKKGTEYFAQGNTRMGTVCRARALGCANRAVKFSSTK